MTEINKVTAGDPILQALTAPTWNEIVDAVSRSKRDDNALLSEFARHTRQTGIGLVKNATDDHLPRFSILGIDEPIILPDDSLLDWQNDSAFKGIVPTDLAHLSRWVVCLEPVPKTAIRPCVISGATKAKVIIDDVDHRCCDVDDGETATLRSSTQGGATILTKQFPDSTGEMWCDIRLADCSGGQQGGTVQNASATLTLGCDPNPDWPLIPFDDILGSTSGKRFFLNPDGTVTLRGGNAPLKLTYKVYAINAGSGGVNSDDAIETEISYIRDEILTPIPASYAVGILDDTDKICQEDPVPPPYVEKDQFEATSGCGPIFFNAQDGDIFCVSVNRLAGSNAITIPSISSSDGCSFFTFEIG